MHMQITCARKSTNCASKSNKLSKLGKFIYFLPLFVETKRRGVKRNDARAPP